MYMEKLFEEWAGNLPTTKIQVSANGSNRKYFRLSDEIKSCIAAHNDDVRENEAFFHFADELAQRGIAVPEVYAVSEDRTTYLQTDLGNVTLYGYLLSRKNSGVDVTSETVRLYKKAIDLLIDIQGKCSTVDFSHSYPRPNFDRQAFMWDFNYFKYYFLKLFGIPFDEQLLENDFCKLVDYLLDEDCGFFVHRDFQSRNFMIVNDDLYLIDFQGARRGAAQYDLASLLYSSKADLSIVTREQLLSYYIERRTELSDTLFSEHGHFDASLFENRFYAYVLARMMQAMGAYGFRGMIEKKDLFIRSIPVAVNNMRTLMDKYEIPVEIPHLKSVLKSITEMPEYGNNSEVLTVSVFSFSYKKGIPFDKSGNGGGFVFDCRCLPNPGLYDEYRQLNGRDKAVVDFFTKHTEVEAFLSYVKSILDFAVKSYKEKGYTRLMVNFGCTGGRHRSVYCAEQISKFLRDSCDCDVSLHHLEQSKL